MANAKASPNPVALPTSPSLAQTLPSDAVLVTRLIEAHSTGMLCSIFLLDDDRLR